MCGICGVIGPGVDPMQKRLLAVLNLPRGRDSVGFWNGERRVRAPESLDKALEVGNRIPSYVWDTDVFLCHLRAASPSHKTIDKSTTHPFAVGKIIGAHNGYIQNWKSLETEFEKTNPHVKGFGVDSQYIFFLIDKYGFDGLKKLRGVAACWWLDKNRPNEIFLYSSGKELHFSQDPQTRTIAFSSERRHLAAAGFRYKIHKLGENGEIWSINTDSLKMSKYQEEYDFMSYSQTAGYQQSWDGFGYGHAGNRALGGHYQVGLSNAYKTQDVVCPLSGMHNLFDYKCPLCDNTNRAIRFLDPKTKWRTNKYCGYQIWECTSCTCGFKDNGVLCSVCEGWGMYAIPFDKKGSLVSLEKLSRIIHERGLANQAATTTGVVLRPKQSNNPSDGMRETRSAIKPDRKECLIQLEKNGNRTHKEADNLSIYRDERILQLWKHGEIGLWYCEACKDFTLLSDFTESSPPAWMHGKLVCPDCSLPCECLFDDELTMKVNFVPIEYEKELNA